MRCILALAVALFLLPPLAHADPLQDGKAAYDRKDYQTALKLLLPFAERGNADAQYDLGWMYDSGRGGVKRDGAEAMKWYTKAVEQNNAPAQVIFGLRAEMGKAVKRDYAEAFKWYRKAADQGYSDGQAHVGKMYEKGEGLKQDYAEAYFWESLAVKSEPLFPRNYAETAEKNLTLEQKVAIDKRIAEWKSEAPAPAAAAPGK